MSEQRLKTYVWSRNIRLFHWLNVTCILLLIIIGLIIFNGKTLGISVEAKVMLKEIHVLVGYMFCLNLLYRLVIGFIGKGLERWSNALPFFKVFRDEVKNHHSQKVYQGHNPAGKLMVAALLTCMSIQMVTGLVIAGTDIYYPPFGSYFAESIAIDKEALETIKPYSKENVDEEAYKEMRAFRKPFITMHVYSFYTLLLLIPLHILGVIFGERKEKSSLVSAMIHGYKYLPGRKE